MTLHKNLHTPLRLTLAATLVGAAGQPLLGPRWTLALAVLSILGGLGTLWILWYGLKGPGAALARLERRWLDLHGARSAGPCHIAVHDGMQPLRITIARAGRDLTAVVRTPAPESTLSFRVWPSDAPAPGFAGSATRDLAPDLTRVPEVEQRFSLLLRAEANSASWLQRLMTQDLLAALLTVRHEAPEGTFRGLTWDGRELSVHWAGELAGDPPRALQLSRALWRELLAEV